MRLPAWLFSVMLCGGLNAQVTVVNGASFRIDQAVTGGSWAAAFGAFAGVSDTLAAGFPLPATLGGVTVTVGGVESPLYFVSSRQINFLVPYQLTPGLHPVQVKTPGGVQAGTVRIMSAAPGIFIKDTGQQQPPKGAILNQDGTENTSSNPVRRGQVISIFATGPGRLDRELQDGAQAPGEPLVRTRSTPQVFIGGVEARVQFSGLAPGFAGLWQINAFVPEKAFLAGRTPVQVFMDGVDSNEVTIFVTP